MSQPGPVLAHLLEGRDALLLEIRRLATAVEELDAVIARIGGTQLRDSLPGPLAAPARTEGRRQTGSEPVNRQVDVESGASTGGTRTRPAGRARKAAGTSTGNRARAAVRSGAATKKTAPGGAAGDSGNGSKSIRVHVLDMLGEQDREFGLAEIIERIHGYGIQAHDDAVRSITIKLMKDGRVERVGRGQYRLARRGGAGRSETASPTATQPARTSDAAAAPTASAPETAQPQLTALASGSTEVPAAGQQPGSRQAGPSAASQANPAGASADAPRSPAGSSYPPHLNLAQPWDGTNR